MSTLGMEAGRTMRGMEACGIDGAKSSRMHELVLTESIVDVGTGCAWQERLHKVTRVVELGSVDILVNNADIQHVAPVEEFPVEKWEAVIAINLSAAFHAIRAALSHMKARNWGRIVNIASTHGLVASAQKSAYVAAKHGVLGLTKVVALETATTAPEAARIRLLAEKQPSHEFATPEQIGGAAPFLCSQAAAQIRGIALPVDGGWTAQ